MYTNTQEFGAAHIFLPEDAERVRSDPAASAPSLCEHVQVPEASALFHVGDAFSHWRHFLAEDSVCSECAEAWLSLVNASE